MALLGLSGSGRWALAGRDGVGTGSGGGSATGAGAAAGGGAGLAEPPYRSFWLGGGAALTEKKCRKKTPVISLFSSELQLNLLMIIGSGDKTDLL